MKEAFLTLFIIFELFIHYKMDFLNKLCKIIKILLIVLPITFCLFVIIINSNNKYDEDIDKIISFINHTQQEKGNSISSSQINFTVKEINYNLDDINYEKYNLNYILNDINTTYKIYDIENKGFYYFPDKDKVSKFPIKHKSFSEYEISHKNNTLKNSSILFITIIISCYILNLLFSHANHSYKHIKIEKERRKRVAIRVLEYYGSIFISYFTSLFFTGKLVKYFEYVKSIKSSKIDNPNDRVIFDYLGLATTTVTLITLFAIIVIFFYFIKNNISLIAIILFISIAILMPFILPNASRDCIYSSSFVLSYIFSWIVTYNFLKTSIDILPYAYDSLKTNGELDPAKLTLLWTIIVFILGVAFKIKP